MWIGPQFRVVQCDCHFHLGYQNKGDWCDFCRCPTCGKDSLRAYEQHWRAQGQRGYLAPSEDINVSTFLLVLAALCLLYAPDQTHRLLYAMAFAGVIFLVHHMNDKRVRYIYNHSYLF